MFDVWLKVKGSKSGEIKGYSTNAAHKDWIEVLSYEHVMEAPVDARSGTASGRVQFNPIKVVKQIDQATPMLYQALTQNENLPEVLFEFWTSGASGGIQKYLDIKLTNARIVHSSMDMSPDLDNTKMSAKDMAMGAARGAMGGRGSGNQALVTQTIQFTYDTMSWTHSGFAFDGKSLGGPKTAEAQWAQM